MSDNASMAPLRYQFRLVDLFVLATFVSVALAIALQIHVLLSIPLTVWLITTFIRYQTLVWKQLKIDRALNWQMEIFLLIESAVQALLFLILLSPILIMLVIWGGVFIFMFLGR